MIPQFPQFLLLNTNLFSKNYLIIFKYFQVLVIFKICVLIIIYLPLIVVFQISMIVLKVVVVVLKVNVGFAKMVENIKIVQEYLFQFMEIQEQPVMNNVTMEIKCLMMDVIYVYILVQKISFYVNLEFVIYAILHLDYQLINKFLQELMMTKMLKTLFKLKFFEMIYDYAQKSAKFEQLLSYLSANNRIIIRNSGRKQRRRGRRKKKSMRILLLSACLIVYIVKISILVYNVNEFLNQKINNTCQFVVMMLLFKDMRIVKMEIMIHTIILMLISMFIWMHKL
ncbi:unnamed protein product [Paramecium pentaurelia]|uniref:Transmembrane protein n=1 Tax=Paramecium pentaurelia TaxID=43138 RepID=A0A8S1WVY9_9CILI|nr:unnamed protein product [Paramecium pentaurelia]